MTGAFLAVIVVVVVAVAMLRNGRKDRKAHVSETGAHRLLYISRRGGEIWLSDTQQHSLSSIDPVYVSTMQQASGYCTR